MNMGAYCREIERPGYRAVNRIITDHPGMSFGAMILWGILAVTGALYLLGVVIGILAQ